jgi:RimJ/RimL family protein N-acetyltransferase
METLTPVILHGTRIRLEPLGADHFEGMRRAADAEPIWRFTTMLGHGEHFPNWWQAALTGFQQGARIPYAVLHSQSAEILGSTSFLHLALTDGSLEIGHTWYSPNQWASHVNPECKLLLMTYAFETLGLRRVEYCVDAINLRSRAAVTKLGAVQEGILRSHRVTQTGRIRDTVYFSILENEWPEVKRRLQARLARHQSES